MSADVKTDAMRRQLINRLGLCNGDELEVVDALLARIELGRERYGHLNLAKARDWEREEAEELLDMRVYQACQAVIARRAQVAAVSAGQQPPRHWLAEHDRKGDGRP